jgi:DNA-binding transcriptional LysR family regulator
VPTGEALSLYREVERSFVGLDRIAQAAKDLRDRRAGTLRIAALPALANGFLPRLIGRFLAKRPKLDLALHGLPSPIVLEWTAMGLCDIGVAELPVEHPSVVTTLLPEVTAVAAVPAGHPLVRRRRLVPSDFEGQPFVSLGQSSLLRFRIDAIFADHGITRQMRVETPLAIVAGTPVTAADLDPARVVLMPFEPAIRVEQAVLRSSLQSPSGVAMEFVSELTRAIGEVAAGSGRAAAAGGRSRSAGRRTAAIVKDPAS